MIDHCVRTVRVLQAGMVILTVWLFSGHRGAGGEDYGPSPTWTGHQVKPNDHNMLKQYVFAIKAAL